MRLAVRTALTAGAASVSLMLGASCRAQAVSPSPVGEIAPASEKVQPFAGLWSFTESDMGLPPKPVKAEFTDAYKPIYAELIRKYSAHEFVPTRTEQCIPSGWPEILGLYARFEANADYITQFGGDGPAFRVIWLNRREHRADAVQRPSLGGDNIAHWEGDTLVNDIVGIDPESEIILGMPFHDPDLHAVERFRMLDPNKMEIVTTITSPRVLAKPWTYRQVLSRHPSSGKVIICSNPINASDSGLDLTPPDGGYVPPGADK